MVDLKISAISTIIAHLILIFSIDSGIAFTPGVEHEPDKPYTSYPCFGYFENGQLQIKYWAKTNTKTQLELNAKIYEEQQIADLLGNQISDKCTSLNMEVKREDLENVNWEKIRISMHNLITYEICVTTRQTLDDQFLSEEGLRKFLIFEFGSDPWEIEQLWSLGVNLTVIINGKLLLSMNHGFQSFNFTPAYGLDPTPIVRSLGHSTGLRSLALYNADVKKELNFDPAHLEVLFFYWVTIPKAIEFVGKCRKLQKFTGPLFGDLDLTTDLISKELKEVTVFDPTVFCSLPRTLDDINEAMTDLHLSKSKLHPSVEQNLWKKFPNLKRISVTPTKQLGTPPTPSLLKSFLDNLPLLESIKMTNFGWNESTTDVREEMQYVLRESGLNGYYENFVLEKCNNCYFLWKGKVAGSNE